MALHGAEDTKMSTTAIALSELAEETDKQIIVKQLGQSNDRYAQVPWEQRGWIYNKAGWKGGSVKIHFLEDGRNASSILKNRKELTKRKKVKERAAQGHRG